MLELRAITYPGIVPHLLKVLEDSLVDARSKRLLLRARPARCLSSLLQNKCAGVAARSLKLIHRILVVDERADLHFINDLFNIGIIRHITMMLQGQKSDIFESALTVLRRVLDYEYEDQMRRIDVQGCPQLLNLFERLDVMDTEDSPSAEDTSRVNTGWRVPVAVPDVSGEDAEEVGRNTKNARDELLSILCGVIAHSAESDAAIQKLLQDHGRDHIMRGLAKRPVKRAPPIPSQVGVKIAVPVEKRCPTPEPTLLDFSEDTPMKEKTIAPILRMMCSKDMYQRTQAANALKKITARKVVDKDDLCLNIIKTALQRLTNEDDTIVAHACGILANIVHTKNNILLLRLIGGIQPIVKCLESYHTLVLQEACRAVRALSKDALMANELFTLGVIPLLVTLLKSADDVIRVNAKAGYQSVLQHAGANAYAVSAQLIATSPWEIVQKQWRRMEQEETGPSDVQALMAQGRLPGTGGLMPASVSDVDARHIVVGTDPISGTLCARAKGKKTKRWKEGKETRNKGGGRRKAEK